MKRRTFMTAAGGATVTGLGALAFTSGAGASSSGSFSADNASVTTHDGDVSKVTVTPSGSVEWSDFDEDITEVAITIDSRILSGDQNNVLRGWETVYTNSFGLGNYAGHSQKFSNQQLGTITLYGGETGRPTDAFDEPDDGDSNEVVVQLRVTIELLNADGDLADPSDEATIQDDQVKFRATATNAEASSSADGNFDTGME